MKWKTMKELEAETRPQFYGTAGYYFNPLYRQTKYTDGVQFLGANGFGWLIDEIGLNMDFAKAFLKAEGGNVFFIVVLDVKDTHATLSLCEDIDGEKLINVRATKEITYTDAPQGRLCLYWQAGVILLPSEY